MWSECVDEMKIDAKRIPDCISCLDTMGVVSGKSITHFLHGPI